jgi:hypothetical protein
LRGYPRVAALQSPSGTLDYHDIGAMARGLDGGRRARAAESDDRYVGGQMPR